MTSPAESLSISPEITGLYLCPQCANRTEFVGHDDRGFPGDDCTCGGYRSEPEGVTPRECVCHVTLSQPFIVLDGRVVEYQLFTGGGDNATIDSYTRIDCAKCDTEIWREQVCISCCKEPATTKSEGVGWPVCESCAAQEATAIQNK